MAAHKSAFKYGLPVALALLMLAGCMGKKPDPVAVSQAGDEEKTCPQLGEALNLADANIWRLNRAEDEKSRQNAFFGTAAVFLIVPALFMDVGTAQQQEIAAWQERKRHLLWLAQQKNCGFKDSAPQGGTPTGNSSSGRL